MKRLLVLFFSIIGLIVLTGCAGSSDKNSKIEAEEMIKVENWKESPLFESNNFSMIGQEGRAGFIYENSEVDRFYTNRINKYMWHFWGSEEELSGAFQVIGTHEKRKEPIVVVPEREGQSSLSPNNGADHHIPSNMALPKKGLWKLDVVIDDKIIGTVFVEVHEK
ncbi:DUF4871 domain-containing protein [Planococcus sp. 1R117A]|uniref:DUF4871 domain-containing protein n=1 Tax=Planococcus sp. 1R117A TaxID=3447020 RepID=UPI003EDCAD50